MNGKKNSPAAGIIAVVLITALYLIADVVWTACTVDRRIAEGFADAMSADDINEVNRYFASDTDTLIEYRANENVYSKEYKSLRKNVSIALMSDKVDFNRGESWLVKNSEKPIFKDGSVPIACIVQTSIGSETLNITADIQNNGYKNYQITKFSSDDPVFGYIFFGIAP